MAEVFMGFFQHYDVENSLSEQNKVRNHLVVIISTKAEWFENILELSVFWLEAPVTIAACFLYC